jgi:hypothetical protein
MGNYKYLILISSIVVSMFAFVACGSVVGLATGEGEIITNEDEMKELLIEIDRIHNDEINALRQQVTDSKEVVSEMVKIGMGDKGQLGIDAAGDTMNTSQNMIVHPNYRNTSKLIELGKSYLAGLYKEGSPDPVVFSEASTSLINRVEELLMEGPSETELEIEYNSEIDDLHGEIDELHEWIDNMREEIEKAKNHIIDVETERDALIYRANESSEMIETVKGLIIVDTSETETIMAADSKNTGIWLQDNETLGAISAQVKKSIDEDSKAARTSRIDVINAVAEVENTVFKEDVKNFMYDKNMTAAEAEEAITNMFDQAAGILNCVPTSIILQNETGQLQGKVQFDESGNVNFDGVGNSCSDIDGIDGKRYKAIPGDTYVGK